MSLLFNNKTKQLGVYNVNYNDVPIPNNVDLSLPIFNQSTPLKNKINYDMNLTKDVVSILFREWLKLNNKEYLDSEIEYIVIIIMGLIESMTDFIKIAAPNNYTVLNQKFYYEKACMIYDRIVEQAKKP